MKKLSKSTYILVPVIIVILIYLIGMYNYRKPITIHKTFNEAVVMEKGSKVILKKTTIEVNAKLHRGLYRGSILDFNAHFTNQLEGKIVIDNNEYSFYGGTENSNINNIIGSVYKNNENMSDGFMLKMYDLDSISLIGVGTNVYNYEVQNAGRLKF
jgi:hypothetical protein